MEFEKVHHTPKHEGGGKSSALSLLKKKPMWLIAGAGVVILLVLFTRNRGGQVQETSAPISPSDIGGYPTPSESASGGLTFEDVTGIADSLIGEQFAGWQQETQDYIDSKNSAISDKLDKLVKDNESLQDKVDNITGGSNTPAPITTKTPYQTTMYALQGDTKKSYTSLGAYLEDANNGNSGASARKEIAKNLGMKNYTGTKEQNDAILKKLVEQDKKSEQIKKAATTKTTTTTAKK